MVVGPVAQPPVDLMFQCPEMTKQFRTHKFSPYELRIIFSTTSLILPTQLEILTFAKLPLILRMYASILHTS